MTAVEMYHRAARETRVGAFGAIPLMHTLTPESASAVLNEYSDQFPTRLSRQNCFEKMMIIDRIATEIRQTREEKVHREREEMRKAEQDRKNGAPAPRLQKPKAPKR